MLIITWRPGESFFVGDDVEIVVLSGSSRTLTPRRSTSALSHGDAIEVIFDSAS